MPQVVCFAKPQQVFDEMFGLDADLTDEQKIDSLREVDEHCPVSDNLKQLTTVTTELMDA